MKRTPRLSRLTAAGVSRLVLTLVAAVMLHACGGAVEDSVQGDDDGEKAEEPRGLRVKEEGVQPGYVLYAPLLSNTTYLIDEDGQVVHTWKSEYSPQGSVYLLESGNLIYTARSPRLERFSGGGQGGRIQEFTWDGELVWDFQYATTDYLSHHDVEILPNGNILAIAWENKTVEEAQKAGRRPDLLPEKGLWPDKVVEIEPIRPDGGRIVWEWHAWDHLIQDYDPEADNYGNPSAAPWRININGDGKLEEIDPAELEQLKALGYVPDDADAEDIGSDLFHTNAVAYNADLDQIALSTPRFNEIWIIDHSTTIAEAAGSTGGRAGRGGDLLYRWGNPAVYGRGTEADKKLGGQHDIRWIANSLPGAGHLTVFNNNIQAAEESAYSAVYELETPLIAGGRYELPDSGPFGPAEPIWSYFAPDTFHSSFISGAERQPNGNTLICSGAQGRFLEVTPEEKIVWEYWTPYSGNVETPEGEQPQPVGENTYAVFRASKIRPDHPALAGRDLSPVSPQPAPVKRMEKPETGE